MNLAYFYPIIYWNTACLSVDASAINQSDFYNLIDDGIIDEDDLTPDDDKKIQNKMDYAKIAAALDSFKGSCNIELPDINESRLGFTPNSKDNTIVYGLKGISKITDPTVNEIMQNRPFKSLDDFLSKRTKKIITKDKVINLIKCGAFNNVEHKSTEDILKEFILMECDQKKRLTMQNASMLIDYALFPSEFEYEENVYKLTKELRKHRDEQKMWYEGDSIEIPQGKIGLWRQIIKDSKVQPHVLEIDGTEHHVIDSNAWDNFYKQKMNKLSSYIKGHHDELLKKLNQKLFDDEWNKYCKGDELKWELDSLNFYFNGHPLKKAIKDIPVEIDHLDDIVEGKQDGAFYIKNKVIPKMHLYTIAGTVIDKDRQKGTVTLQCIDGVITLKLYKDLFATFISVATREGRSQSSFFDKGTHLLVTGIKRGLTFVPKVYKNTGRKSIMRINLDKNNNFESLEEKWEVTSSAEQAIAEKEESSSDMEEED